MDRAGRQAGEGRALVLREAGPNPQEVMLNHLSSHPSHPKKEVNLSLGARLAETGTGKMQHHPMSTLAHCYLPVQMRALNIFPIFSSHLQFPYTVFYSSFFFLFVAGWGGECHAACGILVS